MVQAFFLALGQLGDPRVVRVLLKSAGLALLLFALLAVPGWWGIDLLLERAGLSDASFAAAEGLRGLVALIAVLLGGWLLWRVLALAALQFFADEVVMAVEARHYPDALDRARSLGWHEELANGLRGAGRAVGYNLLALPVAVILLPTGIGPALLFGLVNAVLLGRELTDMVWVRHRHDPGAPLPLSGLQRLFLGGVVTAMLTVPFVNLLAPVLGAAAATHMVHRKGTFPHAA